MICGFNIAILTVILLRGSQSLVGRRYFAWVALGGVATYAVLVGAEASVVQAAIMAAIPIRQAMAGEIIDIGDGVRLEILNPTNDQRLATSDQNDESVALRLVYDEFTLLLTGDAGQDVELEMMESG